MLAVESNHVEALRLGLAVSRELTSIIFGFNLLISSSIIFGLEPRRLPLTASAAATTFR